MGKESESQKGLQGCEDTTHLNLRQRLTHVLPRRGERAWPATFGPVAVGIDFYLNKVFGANTLTEAGVGLAAAAASGVAIVLKRDIQEERRRSGKDSFDELEQSVNTFLSVASTVTFDNEHGSNIGILPRAEQIDARFKPIDTYLSDMLLVSAEKLKEQRLRQEYTLSRYGNISEQLTITQYYTYDHQLVALRAVKRSKKLSSAERAGKISYQIEPGTFATVIHKIGISSKFLEKEGLVISRRIEDDDNGKVIFDPIE